MVVPLKRRATPQRARKGTSRLGFDALARTLCCAPCKCTTAIRRGARRVSEPVRQKHGS